MIDDDHTVGLLVTVVLTVLGYLALAEKGAAALTILNLGERIDLLVINVG